MNSSRPTDNRPANRSRPTKAHTNDPRQRLAPRPGLLSVGAGHDRLNACAPRSACGLCGQLVSSGLTVGDSQRHTSRYWCDCGHSFSRVWNFA
jgi:hypothetical protein